MVRYREEGPMLCNSLVIALAWHSMMSSCDMTKKQITT